MLQYYRFPYVKRTCQKKKKVCHTLRMRSMDDVKAQLEAHKIHELCKIRIKAFETDKCIYFRTKISGSHDHLAMDFLIR